MLGVEVSIRSGNCAVPGTQATLSSQLPSPVGERARGQRIAVELTHAVTGA